MKPEIFDGLKQKDYLEPLKMTLAREMEERTIVSPWKEFKTSENAPNLKTIVEIAEPGISVHVARNLFLYNSKAIIIEGPKNQILIDLPDVGVIVDLFHQTKDEFVGITKYNNPESLVEKILATIGKEDYVFNSLNEAQSVIKTFLKDCYVRTQKIKKGDILAQGTYIFKENYWRVLLNKLFYGEHNWTCSISYLNSIERFKYSLLPYDVICYECMPYIRDDGQYCIETKVPLDASKINIDDYDDNRHIAILTCLSANNPEAEGWRGETSLKFMGVYKLDISKSKEENHLAFKLATNYLYL